MRQWLLPLFRFGVRAGACQYYGRRLQIVVCVLLVEYHDAYSSLFCICAYCTWRVCSVSISFSCALNLILPQCEYQYLKQQGRQIIPNSYTISSIEFNSHKISKFRAPSLAPRTSQLTPHTSHPPCVEKSGQADQSCLFDGVASDDSENTRAAKRSSAFDLLSRIYAL
jgi:hypothetical protein